MFWPVIGLSAAAVGMIQLGVLAVTVVYLKMALAVAVVIAFLLALGHVWRWHKDRRLP